MSETNELEVLARAALYIPELARGVEGEVEITGGWGSGEQSGQEAVKEAHEAQITLFAAGWRRDKRKERRAPYTHNIEVACYRRQFKPGEKSRWIYVTVAIRFGLVATFHGVKELPW